MPGDVTATLQLEFWFHPEEFLDAFLHDFEFKKGTVVLTIPSIGAINVNATVSSSARCINTCVNV